MAQPIPIYIRVGEDGPMNHIGDVDDPSLVTKRMGLLPIAELFVGELKSVIGNMIEDPEDQAPEGE